MLQRAPRPEYLQGPVGRWTSGDGWLHFCSEAPSLAGCVVWGHVDTARIAALLECATAAASALPARHPALLDGRRVQSVDAGEFVTVATFMHQSARLFHDRVTQLAGVRPPGFAGAFAEGFFRIVPAPYPVQMFEDRAGALRWMRCEVHARAIDDIEDLAGAVASTSRVLAELRGFIERSVRCSRAAAARALGLSVRSLQRRLADEGTTFQREVAWARVRVAQRLMAGTDAALAEVAADAGFPSPAAFSAVFRRLVGQTPREWRDARRGKGRSRAS